MGIDDGHVSLRDAITRASGVQQATLPGKFDSAQPQCCNEVKALRAEEQASDLRMLEQFVRARGQCNTARNEQVTEVGEFKAFAGVLLRSESVV